MIRYTNNTMLNQKETCKISEIQKKYIRCKRTETGKNDMKRNLFWPRLDCRNENERCHRLD